MRRVSARTERIAVIGAGASPLVGTLVDVGYGDVHAVDISDMALDRLRAALGRGAAAVTFVRADARALTFRRPVDVWHDRATLHFLTDHDDRLAYAASAAVAVRPGGHLVLAGFAPDGPTHCSGLPVHRGDAPSLATLFAEFTLRESFERTHRTPRGAAQRFLHAVLERR
ncbi:class I SAM-dependent methyltransferase [soil metagenome]